MEIKIYQRDLTAQLNRIINMSRFDDARDDRYLSTFLRSVMTKRQNISFIFNSHNSNDVYLMFYKQIVGKLKLFFFLLI